VLKPCASFIQCRSDYLDATTRLQVWIALTNQLTVLIDRRTTGDGDMWPDTNGAAIADERLPGCTRVY